MCGLAEQDEVCSIRNVGVASRKQNCRLVLSETMLREERRWRELVFFVPIIQGTAYILFHYIKGALWRRYQCLGICSWGTKVSEFDFTRITWLVWKKESVLQNLRSLHSVFLLPSWTLPGRLDLLLRRTMGFIRRMSSDLIYLSIWSLKCCPASPRHERSCPERKFIVVGRRCSGIGNHYRKT